MDCDLENEDAVDYDNLNWSPLPLYPPSFVLQQNILESS